ncbi:hypothetical protein BH18ACI1_BH18ACI1_06330 [soil metagenome]
MKNLARGSVFLGLVVLIAVLFYFQPTVEAKNAFNIAIDSQANLQQTTQQTNNQTQNNQTQTIQPENQGSLETNGEMAAETRSFRATAYCLKGRTASGRNVRRGIVAADPRILPLGTRIEISAGSYSGTYTVADTGGAVKGRILDIWVPSCAEANRFGRRSVKVGVLSKRKGNRT